MADDGSTTVADWHAEITNVLIPMLSGVDVVVLPLVPMNPLGSRQAVELGIAILLDKPILALVPHGAVLPRKLVWVVDRFIEVKTADIGSKEVVERVRREALEMMRRTPRR